MKNPAKDTRKQFRFTSQMSSLLAEWSGRLGMTESKLVSTVLFAYLTDSSNFITCPKAGPDAWIKEEIQNSNPIQEFTCKNGNKFWWDFEKDKVIKVKNL